ncbi:MAG TPA: aa3-type cytochrome c oxidase subunit IV [Novosphingobium sp.]|nr:aa3-type cytochrome c oxidase subunit IV [Novosphingobium sp.]HMP55986.1 aa3-type cytochrome c oxidase subunit IV [Novosphingobium sp.]
MASDNSNMKAHAETYDGFLGMLKWGTIATVIIVAFVIGLIAS